MGSDSHVLFWDFWKKSQKGKKLEILGKNGLLRRNVGNPRSGVIDLPSVGYLSRGEAEVPKWHPLGTPRRSYCSQRAIFGFLFLITSYSYTDRLRTLIND